MDMNEIRKRLAACKGTANAVDNVMIAREFINDYLYNLDLGLAQAFINSKVKDKFVNLKAPELRELITFCKEINRNFLDNHQTKYDNQGDELPPWYEYNEKSGKLRFMPSVLADYCAKNEHVFFCGESYYFYVDGVYVQRDELMAQQRIRSHMAIDKYKTSSQISVAEHQWRMEICKTVREINVNAYLMNFKNGVYNIHSDSFSEHNPKVLSTIQLNANYGTNAECPVFMQYLDGVLPKSEHPLVKEMLGYILIAVTKAQKAFLLVGNKDSGKSTMLYLINTLLGEDNYSTLTWQNLDERFATFQLFGKLANVFADLPSQSLKDTGNFKAITGEDCIMIESKHKNGFSYKPFCTLVFSCNKIPKNYNDRSDAFFGRLIALRFDNTIPVEKQDRGLKEKLLKEIDGIMAWSLIFFL
jgi:putative DNA primase/helicase